VPATRTAAHPTVSGSRRAAPTRSGAPRSSSTTRSATAKRAAGPREAQALREALLLRQALAARPDLTAEQLTALRAAAAPRRAPGAPRTPARRTPAGRPASRTRRTRARRSPARPGRARRLLRAIGSGASWATRLRVVALSTVLLPASLSLALPAPQDPGHGGPQDVTTLALTARSSLLEKADRYRLLEQEVTLRSTELQQARAAVQAAHDQVAAEQEVLGATAAALYRAAAQDRLPLLGLSVHDAPATSDVLFLQALADRADRALDGALVRAERTEAALAAATERVAAAEAAVGDAGRRAADVLETVRAQVDALSPEVSATLSGLSPIPAAGAQQDRNQRAVQRWQDYLNRLAAAGIEPPPAADLTDSAHLPAGMSPALDADGRPIPGVVWAVIGNEPVTVLPSETVAAVSNALSQLGKPFVAGTAGPETYDCGGFTAASWLVAGFALPGTPQDQWAAGAPVPVDRLQVGDLVFSPGGLDVGLYLGDGDVMGASAGTYQVGVRSVAAGSSAVRVTLPAPSARNAPLPPGGDAGLCGAALPQPGNVSPAWGGWANGRIPLEALCPIGVNRHVLRCDAAAGYAQLSTAYQGAFGTPLCITDSYRSFASQVSAFARKPALAAVPGTSNHGWALAVDLCGGINVAGSPQWNWMTANAGRFGWVQPDWARPGAEKPEPWHWEFGYIS
jgi:cell wall-associated NlpC family hydrolase